MSETTKTEIIVSVRLNDTEQTFITRRIYSVSDLGTYIDNMIPDGVVYNRPRCKWCGAKLQHHETVDDGFGGFTCDRCKLRMKEEEFVNMCEMGYTQ